LRAPIKEDQHLIWVVPINNEKASHSDQEERVRIVASAFSSYLLTAFEFPTKKEDFEQLTHA
jgi:hypothetical protein